MAHTPPLVSMPLEADMAPQLGLFPAGPRRGLRILHVNVLLEAITN